jgi:hypothetical protein
VPCGCGSKGGISTALWGAGGSGQVLEPLLPAADAFRASLTPSFPCAHACPLASPGLPIQLHTDNHLGECCTLHQPSRSHAAQP